jgi:TetR/AcrR family transcriptional repressor of nem operon
MVAATRERVLEKAPALSLARGFGATSVSTLMQAAGIAKGTLYHHFPGKDDLAFAILDRARTMLLDGVDAAIRDRSPVEALARMFEFVLEHHRERKFVGGCLFGNTALEMSDSGPRYTEFVVKVFDEWRVRVEAVLQQGQQRGVFRIDLRPSEMAEFIVASIEGGIMMSRLRKNEAPLRICIASLKEFMKPRGWMGEGAGE